MAIRLKRAYDKDHTITLVYGAKDKKRNNAVVLAQYMKMLS